MCFSATSSFTVAGLLTGVGVITAHHSKSKPSFAHAIIPLLFAIQQFSEGVVWLTLGDLNFQTTQYVAAYVFIVFAVMLWPTWIPLSLWIMEDSPQRKKILFALSCLGMSLSLLAFVLLTMYPLQVDIFEHHLRYFVDIQSRAVINSYLGVYAIATVLPFFIIRTNTVKTLGLLLLTSLIATYFFTFNSFVSMWCYFAAIASTMVMVVVWQK